MAELLALKNYPKSAEPFDQVQVDDAASLLPLRTILLTKRIVETPMAKLGIL